MFSSHNHGNARMVRHGVGVVISSLAVLWIAWVSTVVSSGTEALKTISRKQSDTVFYHLGLGPGEVTKPHICALKK